MFILCIRKLKGEMDQIGRTCMLYAAMGKLIITTLNDFGYFSLSFFYQAEFWFTFYNLGDSGDRGLWKDGYKK